MYHLYIEGVLVGGTQIDTNTIPDPNFPLTIGRAESFYHDGRIDEVEIFNRALTGDEIAAIYNAGSAGKCKGITVSVSIDIKPGSDPNCFNINGHGVIPVAILGSADFDVNDIDLDSLSFGGLEVRMRGNRGPLCSTEFSNDDEFLDLVCHFEDQPDNWEEGNATATLTGELGELLDGTPFEGTDSICIVP